MFISEDTNLHCATNKINVFVSSVSDNDILQVRTHKAYIRYHYSFNVCRLLAEIFIILYNLFVCMKSFTSQVVCIFLKEEYLRTRQDIDLSVYFEEIFH